MPPAPRKTQAPEFRFLSNVVDRALQRIDTGARSHRARKETLEKAWHDVREAVLDWESAYHGLTEDSPPATWLLILRIDVALHGVSIRSGFRKSVETARNRILAAIRQRETANPEDWEDYDDLIRHSSWAEQVEQLPD